jgi:Ca-activated chloride channel family protein
VGIGSLSGSSIIDTVSGGIKKDLSGNAILSRLNEPLLKQLAAETNGVYVHLADNKVSAEVLLKHLSQIEKKAMGDTSKMNYTTYYFWLAWPMLLLLMAEIFLPDKKKIIR